MKCWKQKMLTWLWSRKDFDQIFLSQGTSHPSLKMVGHISRLVRLSFEMWDLVTGASQLSFAIWNFGCQVGVGCWVGGISDSLLVRTYQTKRVYITINPGPEAWQEHSTKEDIPFSENLTSTKVPGAAKALKALEFFNYLIMSSYA